MDADEAFAPIRKQRENLLEILLVLTMLGDLPHSILADRWSGGLQKFLRRNAMRSHKAIWANA